MEQAGRRSSRIKKKSTRLEGYDTGGPVGVGCLFSFSGDPCGCAWTSLLNLCYRFSSTSGSPSSYVELSLCFLLREKHTINMWPLPVRGGMRRRYDSGV